MVATYILIVSKYKGGGDKMLSKKFVRVIITIAVLFLVSASGCQTKDSKNSDINNSPAVSIQANVERVTPSSTPNNTAAIITMQPTLVEQPITSGSLENSKVSTDTLSIGTPTSKRSSKPVVVTPIVTTTVIAPIKTNNEKQAESTIEVLNITPTPTKTSLESPKVLNTPIVTCDGDVCRIITN